MSEGSVIEQAGGAGALPGRRLRARRAAHRRGPLRRARRRDGHGAHRGDGRPAGARGAPLGAERDPRRAGRGARGASPLRGGGLRRPDDRHLGPADGAARRRAADLELVAPRALDGHRAPGRAPRARGRRRGGSGGRGRRRVQPQRGRRRAGRRGDDPPARPRVGDRSAGPHPAWRRCRSSASPRTRRSPPCWRPACRSGWGSGAAGAACAGSTASTGEDRRGTRSAARRAASSSRASAPS